MSRNRSGVLGLLISAIGEVGAVIGAVGLVELIKDLIVRDLTITRNT